MERQAKIKILFTVSNVCLFLKEFKNIYKCLKRDKPYITKGKREV